jgi:hypothetical protein
VNITLRGIIVLYIKINLIVFLLTVASVCAAPSGLLIIPTADVLDRGIASKCIACSKPDADNTETAFQLQFGLLSGIEIGYDVMDNGTSIGVWNIKSAIAWHEGTPIVALGIQNIRSGEDSQPYIVGCIPMGLGRLHAGFIDTEDHIRPMLGYDRSLSKHLTLQADYTAGDENAASIGLVIHLRNNLELAAGYIRNNSGASRDGYMFNLSWSPRMF